MARSAHLLSKGAYDEAESFRVLEQRLAEFDKSHGTLGNRMYYLATPPDEFAPIIKNLGPRRAMPGAHHHRKAVWPRPGNGARAQRTAGPILR
jgi:glucose-6-phosphate 1-dehydrogenase